MTSTEKYVLNLTQLKEGDLGLLRTHAGRRLDHTLDAFDLFTGLWWPLRQESQRAPRREVAWLVAKLYAYKPLSESKEPLCAQLRRCVHGIDASERLEKKIDQMLTTPLDLIEPALKWALDELDSHNLGINWVKLTDDLSVWERESTRLKWAEQYLNYGGENNAD